MSTGRDERSGYVTWWRAGAATARAATRKVQMRGDLRCRTRAVEGVPGGARDREADPVRPPSTPGWSRSRGPRAILLVAVVVGVAVAALRVRSWRQRKAAIAELSGSLQSYRECILGPPLASGETGRERMRRIEAGLPEVSGASGATTAAPEAWPTRCKRDLERAHATLVSGTLLRGDPAAQRLDALVQRALDDPAPADAPDLVDELLAAIPGVVASRARATPPPNPHAAPAAASPLAFASLPRLPVRTRARPDELPGMDPRNLSLSFIDSKDAGWTCAFTALHGEPLREARCEPSKRAATSILRADASHGPGYIRTARGGFDRFEIVRPIPDGDPDITALPSSVETVALYGDQLVWVTSRRWFARTVTPGHAALGPPVDLGEVSGTSPELAACPTATALIVGVQTRADELGERGSWRAMAARDGTTWQRSPGRSVVDVGATLTCEGHAGTWTWFDRHKVTQVRCNADRCETHGSERVSLSWDVGSSLYAADLGGRALVVGLGTTPGPLLGKSVASVRMRMAPLSAITKASDVVLFSDQDHDGAAVSEVTVYVRDGVALVLLLLSPREGDDGLPYRAIRVDGLGNYSPITLAN